MLVKGTVAPEVELGDLDGRHFSLLEQLQLNSVVLIFFKVNCPTCQFTLPFVERLYSSQSAASPCLFGISQDNAQATVEFGRRFGLSLPVLLDVAKENYPASNAFGITNVPSLFLVAQNRQIEWALNGFHKVELERLGAHFGRSPFEHGERVPALRPG